MVLKCFKFKLSQRKELFPQAQTFKKFKSFSEFYLFIKILIKLKGILNVFVFEVEMEVEKVVFIASGYDLCGQTRTKFNWPERHPFLMPEGA